MGKPMETKEEIDCFDRAMENLTKDLIAIHVKYHEYGHALTNKLIEAAVQHLVHRVKPDFFEGLGYLQYRANDYYLSESRYLNNKP